MRDIRAIRKLGRRGEKLAKRYLKKQGYRHLTSNYTTSRGEVDLIMQDGRAIVFVEVKCRENERFADGAMLVNYGKQQRIAAAARHFIHINQLYAYPLRFDVVVVILTPAAKPAIHHQANAFNIKR